VSVGWNWEGVLLLHTLLRLHGSGSAGCDSKAVDGSVAALSQPCVTGRFQQLGRRAHGWLPQRPSRFM